MKKTIKRSEATGTTMALVSMLILGYYGVHQLDLVGHYHVVTIALYWMSCIAASFKMLDYFSEAKKEHLESSLCLLIVTVPFALLGADSTFWNIIGLDMPADHNAPVMTAGVAIMFVIAILIDRNHDLKYGKKEK